MLREFEYSLIHFSSGSASTGDGHSQHTDQTMRAKVSKIPIEGTYFFILLPRQNCFHKSDLVTSSFRYLPISVLDI